MNAQLQYPLEHFGVAVAAVTGVLAARGKGVDLFGVIVLALVTAFGGGTIRDCTIGDLPVFWVRDPNYVYTAVGTAAVLFFVGRSHALPLSALQVADAFVLALFTMIGLLKALSFGVAAPIAVVMGVITGVAGGILRDLLLGEIPLVFRPVIYLYATAAFFGAVTYVVLRELYQDQPEHLWIGILCTLLLRLAGIRWRLCLPVFVPRDPAAAGAPHPDRE
jgi:uncharacterized membrane protein YeiH